MPSGFFICSTVCTLAGIIRKITPVTPAFFMQQRKEVCQIPRNTTFTRYLVAMDIPMIGRTASREPERHFHGNLREFELAAMDRFDFTSLKDFGETMRDNIHEWFQKEKRKIS